MKNARSRLSKLLPFLVVGLIGADAWGACGVVGDPTGIRPLFLPQRPAESAVSLSVDGYRILMRPDELLSALDRYSWSVYDHGDLSESLASRLPLDSDLNADQWLESLGILGKEPYETPKRTARIARLRIQQAASILLAEGRAAVVDAATGEALEQIDMDVCSDGEMLRFAIANGGRELIRIQAVMH